MARPGRSGDLKVGGSRCHRAGRRRSEGAQTEKPRPWRAVEFLDEEKGARRGSEERVEH